MAASDRDFVMWGYGLQLGCLLFPPLILASLAFSVFIKPGISPDWRVTHVRWQIVTALMALAFIPVAFLFLAVALSGFNTDSLISILATILLYFGTAALPIWFLYRCTRGMFHYGRGNPMSGRVWL